MNEEVIIKVDLQGEEGIEQLDKSLGKVSTSAKKTESEISRLRKELRDAKGDMLKYAEGTVSITFSNKTFGNFMIGSYYCKMYALTSIGYIYSSVVNDTVIQPL